MEPDDKLAAVNDSSQKIALALDGQSNEIAVMACLETAIRIVRMQNQCGSIAAIEGLMLVLGAIKRSEEQNQVPQ